MRFTKFLLFLGMALLTFSVVMRIVIDNMKPTYNDTKKRYSNSTQHDVTSLLKSYTDSLGRSIAFMTMDPGQPKNPLVFMDSLDVDVLLVDDGDRLIMHTINENLIIEDSTRKSNDRIIAVYKYSIDSVKFTDSATELSVMYDMQSDMVTTGVAAHMDKLNPTFWKAMEMLAKLLAFIALQFSIIISVYKVLHRSATSGQIRRFLTINVLKNEIKDKIRKLAEQGIVFDDTDSLRGNSYTQERIEALRGLGVNINKAEESYQVVQERRRSISNKRVSCERELNALKEMGDPYYTHLSGRLRDLMKVCDEVYDSTMGKYGEKVVNHIEERINTIDMLKSAYRIKLNRLKSIMDDVVGTGYEDILHSYESLPERYRDFQLPEREKLEEAVNKIKEAVDNDKLGEAVLMYNNYQDEVKDTFEKINQAKAVKEKDDQIVAYFDNEISNRFLEGFRQVKEQAMEIRNSNVGHRFDDIVTKLITKIDRFMETYDREEHEYSREEKLDIVPKFKWITKTHHELHNEFRRSIRNRMAW